MSVVEQIRSLRFGSVANTTMICHACKDENHPAATVCFSCGKSLWMVTRGTIVAGRYEVLSVLGHGGMGVVYKAQDRTLDEPVALKVLRPQLALTQHLANRFHSEIKLARKVRHRNVCAIHEYGEDGPHRYIAMEFIDGVNLRELVRERGPLPYPEACDVALQVLKGLQAVHDLGIIHCDLKTANIMMDTQGVIRLMDFGLAKVRRAEDSAATMTGILEGTPEYMSPEQVLGAAAVDFQSDIYALGIILFELLTGEVPFRGASFVATMRMQLVDLPPLDGEPARLLPAQVVPVLRKALAKDPGERYATAGGMAKALRLVSERTAALVPVEVPLIREDWIDLVEADDGLRRAEVLQALVHELAAGDVPARCGAALTLGRMGARAKDTVPALVKALNDSHAHVADAAASALRRIAGTSPPAAGSPTPVPTPRAAEAVDRGRLDREEGRRIPSLVVALCNDPDDVVRVSAAEALGRIGPRATVAIPALIAALTYAGDEVCDAAAGALLRIGLPAAPALIEAVTGDEGCLHPRAAAVLTEIVATA
jgi:predicted Ser/Thr protein kinase